MSLIIMWAIMGYMMWKIGTPWFIWVVYISTVLFDIVYAFYKAGKEAGKEDGNRVD